jgi:hypothetical protein
LPLYARCASDLLLEVADLLSFLQMGQALGMLPFIEAQKGI